MLGVFVYPERSRHYCGFLLQLCFDLQLLLVLQHFLDPWSTPWFNPRTSCSLWLPVRLDWQCLLFPNGRQLYCTVASCFPVSGHQLVVTYDSSPKTSCSGQMLARSIKIITRKMKHLKGSLNFPKWNLCNHRFLFYCSHWAGNDKCMHKKIETIRQAGNFEKSLFLLLPFLRWRAAPPSTHFGRLIFETYGYLYCPPKGTNKVTRVRYWQGTADYTHKWGHLGGDLCELQNASTPKACRGCSIPEVGC